PTSYNFVATNSTQQCSTTYAVPVTIKPAAAVISVSGTSICSGNSAPLSVSPTTFLTSYAWLPATGLNTSSGANVTAAPTATTVYTITATNYSGCTYSTSATVVVKPLPTVVVPSQGACVGESATLTASGANTYAWSPAASLSSSTGTSVIATPAVTTLYTIVGTGSNGCTNSTTAQVTISTRPEIRIGPSVPDSPQHLQPTKFYSSATGSSYVWSVSTALLSSVPFSGQSTSAISNVAWQAPTNIESTLQKVTLKLDGCSTSLFLPLDNSTGGSVKRCTINGPVTVAPGSIQVYSINCGTSLFPGNTWFVDGGTITAGQGTSSVTVKWGSGYAGRLGYQAVAGTSQNAALDVAICSSTAPVNPSNNSILTPNPVSLCHSAGGMHITAANTGSTYLWSTGVTTQNLNLVVNNTGYADYYYVTVTNTNGCKSSFFQTVITNLGCREAGINSNSVKEINAEAVFYPNPASNKLVFESQDGASLGKVVITNSLGEIIFEKDVNENKTEMDISHFTAGMYMVFTRGTKGKLIKE
ncbi:MAG: T9SS type A sorting domain-containing protein, partial [Bacteroidia bacterium]